MERLLGKPIIFLQGVLVFLSVITNLNSAQGQIKHSPQSQSNQILKRYGSENDKPIKFRIKKFEFKGNQVFSSSELQQVVSSYLNRKITFAELLEARSEITKFYVGQGYITSGAFLPVIENQGIGQGGVFTIQVVEGKVEKIEVLGGRRLKEYVRSRLKKATSPLNSNGILEALQILQIDPLIEGVSAELVPGSHLGQSFLKVRVKTRQPIVVELGADNSRSPTIGRFQRGLQLGHGNLFGFGDRLGLRYGNTDGSSAYSASYSVPVNNKNGRKEFTYGNISRKIDEPPFNRFDIIGDARAYAVSFRQPLIQKVNDNSISEFALGITASRQENKSSLLGDPYPLSRGADENGRTRISALRFFQEWTNKGKEEVLALRSQFSLGIGAFEATINESEPDSRFLSWLGQARWRKQIGEDTSLILKADLQLSDRGMVPLEQFGVGGVTTVRGYREDVFLTDNGFLLSAELRFPVLRRKTSKLYVIPFVDIGTAWNNDQVEQINNTSQQQEGTLASLGLGVEYELGNKLNARLDWGVPLIPVENSNSDSWHEKGLYFSIRYQPF